LFGQIVDKNAIFVMDLLLILRLVDFQNLVLSAHDDVTLFRTLFNKKSLAEWNFIKSTT